MGLPASQHLLPLSETVMPPPIICGWWLPADSLHIPHKVKESHHKLLDIFHTASSAWISFPVSEALLDLVKVIWHTPSMILTTCKSINKKYYVTFQDFGCFSYPLPVLWSRQLINMKGSITLNLHPMIKIINASICLVKSRTYWPFYSLESLAIRCLMVKYNYAKLHSFIERPPLKHRE